jgi:hypothetical protein
VFFSLRGGILAPRPGSPLVGCPPLLIQYNRSQQVIIIIIIIIIILFTTLSRTALGPTQPPIQWVPGALSLGVKRPGREADHSPPFSAEVKNEWSYTSTPQYVLTAWCLVKHRDNFTFSTYYYYYYYYCYYYYNTLWNNGWTRRLTKAECWGTLILLLPSI